MRLLKARIENFLILKEAEVNLDVKSLVLVLGHTSDGGRADSNGVGKSSLFEAVCWCLYGKTYKGISHDDVINTRSKGGTRVELELLIDSDAITVVRHRGHKKHKNKLLILKNGVSITPFNQKDAEVVLESLIPLSYSAFKHVCYFGQGMADKFLALNDTGRKQLLEELLGLETYSDAEKRAKAKLRELKDRELLLLGKQEVLDAEIASKVIQLKQLEKTKTESVASLNAERKALAAENERLEESETSARATVHKTRELEHTIKELLAEEELTLQSLNREDMKLAGKADQLTYRVTSVKKTMQKVSDLKMCSECEQQVAEEHTARRVLELQEELDVILVKLSEVRAMVAKLAAPIAEQDELVSALRQKLSSIDATTPCVELNNIRNALRRNAEIIEELLFREQAISAPSEGLREALEASKLELVGIETELGALALQKPYLAFWEKGFSTSGVRSLLLDDVVTYLNSRMNHHSRNISDGEISIQLSPQTKLKSGDTREKMSVNASTGGAGYKSASGGQQRRMDLAVHFALSDLTSTVTGHRVNLLICDEVLDCIDETGTDAILSILEEKTKLGMTVFLIDHTDAVKNNVNNVLVVSQVNGLSTVEFTSD